MAPTPRRPSRAVYRRHVFIEGGALGRDHRGRAYCFRCNLPETSPRHRPAPREHALDHAQRAAGERPDPDQA